MNLKWSVAYVVSFLGRRLRGPLAHLVASLFFVIPVIGAEGQQSPSGDAVAIQLHKLKDIWSLHRSEVRTAKINYSLFRGSIVLKQLSRASFNAIVADSDFSTESGCSAFLDKICSPESRPKLGWSRSLFTMDGRKSREDDLGLGSTKEYDDDCEIIYDAYNNNGRLYLTGRSNYYHLSFLDFRYVPDPEWVYRRVDDGAPKELLRILAQPDAKSSVTSLELTVDSETGVVNRLSQFDEKDVVREYHQLHFSRQTGDIYFPKTILQANYKNGVLAALTAIAIRSAEFNLIIDPDAFLVPIPDGTNVFDYRNSSAGVTYANVKGSADIRQSLESLAVSWPVQSGVDQFDSSRLVYWAILNLTGFALILGSVVYRRALRKK